MTFKLINCWYEIQNIKHLHLMSLLFRKNFKGLEILGSILFDFSEFSLAVSSYENIGEGLSEVRK